MAILQPNRTGRQRDRALLQRQEQMAEFLVLIYVILVASQIYCCIT
jgi:hypothetical protein